MSRSNWLYRLTGLLLALSMLWTQTGAVVAASVDGGQWRENPETTETPRESVSPIGSQSPEETVRPEESQAPEGGDGLGVEVIDPPVLTEPYEPVESGTPGEGGESTEDGDLAPEESEDPAPSESTAPQETALPTPEATRAPVPAESELPETSSAPDPVETLEPEGAQPPAVNHLPEIVEAPAASFVMPRAAETLNYRLGYGIGFTTTTRNASTSPREYVLLTDLGGRFTVETTESIDGSSDKYPAAANYTRYRYGERYYSGKLIDSADGRTFCVFPTEEMLGRIPDREFLGWYLYPANSAPGGNDAKTWSYEEGSGMADMSQVIQSFRDDPLYTAEYEGETGYLIDEWGDWVYDENGDPIEDPDSTWKRPFGDLGDTWDAKEYDFYAGYGYTNRSTAALVGRWKVSDNSKAADITRNQEKQKEPGTVLTAAGVSTPLQLYSSSIAGKALGECRDWQVDFTPERLDYYLRVDADVTALDLVFNTYELYYDYKQNPNGKECPVTVTGTFAGVDTGYTEIEQTLLPQWEEETNWDDGSTRYYPANSVEDPAHSRWSVSNISLMPSAGGEDLYNDIKVTVTSPSGESTTTYTFHVQRLTEPTLTQNPGNTPIGMIRRDTSAVWQAGAESGSGPEELAAVVAANKARAEANFAANRKFDADIYPNDDAHNQGGSIFRGTYTRNAWLKDDVDLDPTAIIVYQDAAFLDPGITVTDAEGNQVSFSGSAVQRTLRLREQQSGLSVSGIGSNQGKVVELSDTVLAAGGTDQIDLRGRNILPGVYTMEYSYKDPISDVTYDSAGAGFVTDAGAAGKTAFSRTVVVLPMPGDVDMDGAVTLADSVILSRYLGTNINGVTTINDRALTTDPTAALYAFRVCDMDQNGMVDTADLTALEGLPAPQLVSAENVSNSDYYYIPLPTGESESRYTRRSLATGTEGAAVTMEFLGVEKGVRTSEGYYADPTGPWSGASPITGVTLNDVFWVGVRLNDSQKSALLNQSVHTFTFTLTYDEQYVQPATVLNGTLWNDVSNQNPNAADGELAELRWKGMMNYYNLGAGNLAGRTVWGSNYAYGLTEAADRERNFAVHYSKAITPLEENMEVGTKLKELVFSVQMLGNSSVTLQSEGSLWLFAVPFTLVRHPYGKTEAQLIELGAGMADFTLVGTERTAMAANGVANLARTVGLITPVAAYSTQEKIFGDTTGNLANGLSYPAAGTPIPLGEDKTEVYYVYDETTGSTASRTNGIYSTTFMATGGWSRTGEWRRFPVESLNQVEGELPDGLTFDGSRITGIPEEAGTFDVYIGGNPYRIVIDQATLKFWADNQYSYYGQPEFRGEQSSWFTFTYDKDDLKSIELERAEAEGLPLDGDGAKLRTLLADDSYEAPAFTAVTSGTAAVAAGTDTGSYFIRCPLMPESKNYRFQYVEQGRLTIGARPFQVTRLASQNVGTIFADQSTGLPNLKAQLAAGGSGSRQDFVVELARKAGEPEGSYNGYPLTSLAGYVDGVVMPGDVLNITYDAEFVRTQADQNGSGGFFTLEAGNTEEPRDVRVRNIRLTSGGENYYLVDRLPVQETVSGEVVGTVMRRNVLSFNLTQMPPLKYQYGERFTRSNELQFAILKDGDTREGTYAYNEETTTRELGVHIIWATEEERDVYLHPEKYPELTQDRMVEDADGAHWTVTGWEDLARQWEELVYQSGQIFDMRYNGRYLCMYIYTADKNGSPITVRQYATEPLVVSPRTLTLTAAASQRFYGETEDNLTFTYNPAQLAPADRSGTLTGTGEELEQVLAGQGYHAPELVAVDDPADPHPLDARAIPNSQYAVMISGAKCDSGNYVFEYTYVDPVNGNGTRKEFGTNTFAVKKRLIVVEAITRQEPLLTLYADTHRIYTTGLTLAKEEVSAVLPEHTETTTRYYPRGGLVGLNPLEEQAGYAANAPAILEGDEVSFTYTATMASTDGPEYMRYTNFAKGYFNMDEGTNEDGSKDYPVQVSNLQIAGQANGRSAGDYYELVFTTNSSAIQALPTQVVSIQNCIQPEISATRTYYAPGTSRENCGKGRVILRPIEAIEILSPGKVSYVYGESYRPDQPGSDNQVMRINIRYTAEGDNYDQNPTVGTVSMYISHYGEDDQAFTSFDDRSLVLYWLRGEDTPENRQAAIDNGQVLRHLEPLSSAVHDGVHVFIAGKRGNQENLVISEATGEVLRVARRQLTLTANDQQRCYGEENAAITFTFDPKELSNQDQVILANYAGAMDSDALAWLAGARGFVYEKPRCETAAERTSPVLSSGQSGYPITLSGGGLSNYTFAYQPGKLYVYPRPVRIESFVSSKDKPIYTIYADTTAREFATNVTNELRPDRPSVEMGLPQSGIYVLPDGTGLPVTGPAVVGNDVLTLKIRVQFDGLSEGALQGANGQEQTVQVVDAELVSGMAAGNYVLERSGGSAAIVNRTAVGMIELRSIQSIELKARPQTLQYTYGDTLDLSGLMVTLRYRALGTEEDKSEDVPFLGTDQFAEKGLYVNYYDSDKLPAQSLWASIKDTCRTAATGDHLTIAPTHDTQGLANPFSANGKYLIVSAQRHEDQIPSRPLLVDCNRDGVATPITVDPMVLDFTLSAQDKTYDETTQAAGTLSLENVYRRDNYVDAYNRTGIWDQVYPVTGAEYESAWTTLAGGGEDFRRYVRENGYSFSTGRYVPAGSAPLGINHPLAWTIGYRYGEENTLTFRFTDSNVAYAETPGHDNYGELATVPVEVTGIRLGGPDAANYTIAGASYGQTGRVTAENAAALAGYAAGVLPEATIHKANRDALPTDLLPQVEVDPHTNVVRITYDRSFEEVGAREAEAYQSELHYEYALQFDASTETWADLRQWAGEDGNWDWWDQRYFGGEAVTLDLSGLEGYIPKAEDQEGGDADEILKGQVYAWNGEDTGFTLDLSAYPGSLTEVPSGYTLYTTGRTALPRDTVVLPVVRVAETHNYYASPVLSSVAEYTPEHYEALASAWAELDDAGTAGDNTAALEKVDAAARQVLEVLSNALEDARAQARERVSQIGEIAEKDQWPEEWPEDLPTPAVKTYLERIEVISVEELQGEGAAAQGEAFSVPTLEAVWFTDVVDYPKREVLDAVLRNHEPQRYRGYAWDRESNTPLDFENEDSPISLVEPFQVEITRRENNQEITELVWVNEGNNARIYVDTRTSTGGWTMIKVENVMIDQGDFQVVLGAGPQTLTATIYPPTAQNRVIRWSSSDESVVKVDRNGVVTFVGVGTAVITASSVDGVSDSITITVLADWRQQYPNSIFDLTMEGAFFQLAQDLLFHPEAEITRGEAAQILLHFYVENPNWTKTGPTDFPDLTGEEPYAEAARKLGSVGVMVGLADGTFGGEQSISRAEFITLLVRMLGVPIPDTKGEPHAFLDTGEEDTWAYAEIDAMSTQTGVLRGVGDRYFAPARKITRAEAASFLTRLLPSRFTKTEKTLVPKDVDEHHWARNAILQAVNGSDAMQ